MGIIKVNVIYRDINGYFISPNMGPRQCIRLDDRNCQRKCDLWLSISYSPDKSAIEVY